MSGLTLKWKARSKSVPKFYTEVYCDDLTSALLLKGTFVEHARYKAIYKDANVGILLGVLYTRKRDVYFAVNSHQILKHIEKEGVVPVMVNQHIRMFKDKLVLKKYATKLKVAAGIEWRRN